MSDHKTEERLKSILAMPVPRAERARRITEAILLTGAWRWVGIYDVDIDGGLVSNIAWSGPIGPVFLTFPISKGLTSRAIITKKTVSVGDVGKEPDYLQALSSTQSEIIIPVLHPQSHRVIGTLDVESDRTNAFDQAAQALLESYVSILGDFWVDGNQN
ncbi:MAG TPA: GAF domain-containing protein [Candidatus Angelobacter sp.]|nr:GAF domain-containing protein [Candidatus Angelobacter sp.]